MTTYTPFGEAFGEALAKQSVKIPELIEQLKYLELNKEGNNKEILGIKELLQNIKNEEGSDKVNWKNVIDNGYYDMLIYKESISPYNSVYNSVIQNMNITRKGLIKDIIGDESIISEIMDDKELYEIRYCDDEENPEIKTNAEDFYADDFDAEDFV